MYSEILSKLAAPFDPGKVTWYPVISRSDCTICRFEPYVQWRSYIERLNAVLTPAGWEQHLSVCSRRREDSRDAVIGVECTLVIHGVGSFRGNGETRADEARAAMRAEEESLKDACFRFGLDRSLRAISTRVEGRGQLHRLKMGADLTDANMTIYRRRLPPPPDLDPACTIERVKKDNGLTNEGIDGFDVNAILECQCHMKSEPQVNSTESSQDAYSGRCGQAIPFDVGT